MSQAAFHTRLANLPRVPAALAAALLTASLLLGPQALLAQGHSGHGGHAGHTMPEQDSAATLAYKAANDRMHEGMMQPYTNNADIDFLRGMIPHHQGAVDMARIVLEHGQDPELRKLAEQVIATQEAEIAWMQQKLKALAP